MQYKFLEGLFKALLKGGLFALPLVMAMLPQEWMNLTLGTAGYMLADFLQKRYTNL